MVSNIIIYLYIIVNASLIALSSYLQPTTPTPPPPLLLSIFVIGPVQYSLYNIGILAAGLQVMKQSVFVFFIIAELVTVQFHVIFIVCWLGTIIFEYQ